MSSKRLFWAIPVEENIGDSALTQLKKVQVSAKKKDLPVKWVPKENFHITLAFLGEVEEEQISPMLSKVKKSIEHHGPLGIQVKGVGAFPSLENGRHIWLGVKAKKDLVNLADAIKTVLSEDFELDDRDFVPHVTLGRIKNRVHLKDLLSPLDGKDFGKMRVNKVTLFESVLGGPFPVYKEVKSLELGKS